MYENDFNFVIRVSVDDNNVNDAKTSNWALFKSSLVKSSSGIMGDIECNDNDDIDNSTNFIVGDINFL